MIYNGKEYSYILPLDWNFDEAKFTSNRLNCLAKEISNQCSTQASGRVLFTAVKQTYSERGEKAEFRLVGLEVNTQMTDVKVSWDLQISPDVRKSIKAKMWHLISFDLKIMNSGVHIAMKHITSHSLTLLQRTCLTWGYNIWLGYYPRTWRVCLLQSSTLHSSDL